MLGFKKEVRDLERLREILLVLFEQGFGYLLNKISLRRYLPLKKRIERPEKEVTRPEVRLRKTLEKLGPTFIKFGQVLSVRPDLLPKNYIRELEKLQANVPRFSFAQVKKRLNIK